MHVLEPKEIAKRSALHHKKKRRKAGILKAFFVLVTISAIGVAGWFAYSQWRPVQDNQQAAKTEAPTAQPKTETNQPAAPKTKLKTLTGVQFRDLYRSISYPNTQAFTTMPDITGNIEADARIRQLAEKRGFMPTSIPVAPITKTGEMLLGDNGDDLLQPLAQKSWQDLKAAAKKDGIKLTLISAYRSPKWQRDLFMQRLLDQGVSVTQIAAGTADAAVNETLGMTAVPGYSRHHTGYTIDLYCEDGVAFGESTCNAWITKDNYRVAKTHGWIPSYPEDAGEQGPEPEPWEFVWVGTNVLFE